MKEATLHCRNFLLHLQQRAAYEQPVLIKEPARELPPASQITQLHNEYVVTQLVADVPGVRPALAMEGTESQPVLLLEYIQGQSLAELIRSASLDLAEKLRLAVNITTVLSRIHEQQVMHKDMSSSNILVASDDSPGSQDGAYIIDFGLASTMRQENPSHLAPDDTLVGTLAYISPEQTGRMNRQVDYRTDLYSLGVTLYELFTGQLPFESGDALAMIHAHIARQPQPPHQIDAGIPGPVSEIILRLLAKDAEDRYQTAHGLQVDLETCLDQWQSEGRIEPFEMGGDDFTGCLQIPQKLYGRQAEIKQLQTILDRAVTGSAQLVLVAGYSGVGKTSLVHEIQKDVIAIQGCFVEGKFDQFQRTLPYSAWAQAFSRLVDTWLAESETSFAGWRDTILDAVGDRGQVLIDIIPALERVLGPQPDVPQLGGIENQNRFNYTFNRFLSSLATPEHPLLVFLDDLQWIDPASLNLIEALFAGQSASSLLVVGAYRSNEVDADHPMAVSQEGMQAESDRVTVIPLGDLPPDDTNHLLADSLQLSVADCRDLGQVLVEKSSGNPFFFRQLLYALEADRLLEFDREQRCWMWDDALGQSLKACGSVVDLMIRKIRTLPGDTQHALSMAACIGSRFDTSTLHTVIGQPQADILTALNPALQGGLIVQSDGHFSFAHDRIQEAGYALIPKTDLPQTHLEIGRLLLAETAAEDLDEEIFDIVGHLNAGRALIDKGSEKTELATLNLRAGQKAKTTSAYSDAKKYIEIGLELLGTDSWQDQYELTLSLHNENGELASLAGQFDQVKTTADLIHANAKNIHDQVRIYMARIEAETIQYNLTQALQIGLEALKDLGIEIPMHPSAEYCQSLKAGLVDLLSRRREINWVELPEMSDGTALAATCLLASEMSTSYIANPPLYPIVAYRNAILTLEYGVSPWSPFCYAGIATDAVSLVNHETPVDVAREHFLFAQEMQHIARELMKNPFTAISQTKTLLLLSFVSVWIETIEKGIELTQATYRSGYQTGDMLYGSYGAIVFAIESFGAGMDLVAYQSQLSDYADTLNRMGQTIVPQWLTIFLQAAQNLRETFSKPHELKGTYCDEDEWLPIALASNDVSGQHFLSICKLLLAYHFDVDDKLDEFVREAEESLIGGRALFSVAVFYLYAALSKLRLAEGIGKKDLPEAMDLVNSYLQLVEVWSQFAPSTFQHKFDLIAAEKARVTGELDGALSHYEQAISGARENGFTHEEALANELYARFWAERGNDRFASLFMREAHSLYRKWGALAKAEHLAKRYPNWLIERSIVVDQPRTQIISDQITGDLDLLTVLKASQDIASEISLDSLLASLMTNVIENSGAQRGYLILEQDGQWMIAAEAAVDDPEPYVRAAKNVAETDLLAQGIVYYAAGTQETVVLEDASQSGEFVQDPYVQSHQARSILCAPLINQGKTSGILYLENNLAPGVFSSQRVNLLRLLSSQMAISLDNARIHNHLEASEARFRATFEQAAVGIAHVAPDGSFLRLNEKFCDIVGYSQDEMLARTFQDITHPDDLDADLEYVRQLLAGETETYDIEKRYFRKSGEIVWVNLTVSLVRQATGEPDYFVAVVQDITRRKQAEQALRESEQQYRILELDPLLELILDHLGQVVDYHEAAIWIREGDNLVMRAGRTPEGTPSLVGRQVTMTAMTASATIRQMIETTEPFTVADTAGYKDVVQELKAVTESLAEHYERTGTSWLGVPVVAKNRIIGIVSLVSEQPGYYTRAMADSVQTLVDRAAIAIENARLHQQVRQTAALEERARVARELHDSVSQTLFSASMVADTTLLGWDIDPAMGRQNLNQLGQLLRGASAEMRTLLFELRPVAIQNQTPGQLLDPLAEAARARTRATVSLNVEGDRILPENVSTALLRIAQESLNNVAKHAEATEVNVDLVCGPEGVVLRITDDGRGFDPADIPPGHFGIDNMTERAQKIGAIFEVESKPGGGTQVVVTWSEGGEEDA